MIWPFCVFVTELCLFGGLVYYRSFVLFREGRTIEWTKCDVHHARQRNSKQERTEEKATKSAAILTSSLISILHLTPFLTPSDATRPSRRYLRYEEYSFPGGYLATLHGCMAWLCCETKLLVPVAQYRRLPPGEFNNYERKCRVSCSRELGDGFSNGVRDELFRRQRSRTLVLDVVCRVSQYLMRPVA